MFKSDSQTDGPVTDIPPPILPSPTTLIKPATTPRFDIEKISPSTINESPTDTAPAIMVSVVTERVSIHANEADSPDEPTDISRIDKDETATTGPTTDSPLAP
jgi:hypothetical protein